MSCIFSLFGSRLKDNIDRSVMMVPALFSVIGYDQAAAISYHAIDHDLTLKQVALAKGVGEDLFDRVVTPLALTRRGTADIPSGNPPARRPATHALPNAGEVEQP